MRLEEWAAEVDPEFNLTARHCWKSVRELDGPPCSSDPLQTFGTFRNKGEYFPSSGVGRKWCNTMIDVILPQLAWNEHIIFFPKNKSKEWEREKGCFRFIGFNLETDLFLRNYEWIFFLHLCSLFLFRQQHAMNYVPNDHLCGIFS